MPESKIQPEAFYSAPEEKILINWFTYEVALAIETELRDLSARSPLVQDLQEKGIEAVTIALAKGLKEVLVRRISNDIQVPSLERAGFNRRKSSRRHNEGYRRHAQVSKSRKEVSFSPQWMANNAPALANLSPSPTIANCLTRALKDLIRICANCPVQCLHHINAPCTMFDEGPY